jgi:glycosyltransferase involved in cell wall biosynthesis
MVGLIGSFGAAASDLPRYERALGGVEGRTSAQRVDESGFTAAALCAADSSTDRNPLTSLPARVVVTGDAVLRGRRLQPGALRSWLEERYRDQGSLRALAELSGAHAVALHDPERRKVVLATDRLGLMPVYYLIDPRGALLFATAERMLATLVPHSELRLNPAAPQEFVREGQLCGSTTWLADAGVLPPGSIAVFDTATRTLKIESYWSIGRAVSARYGSYAEALESVREAFDDAMDAACEGLDEVSVHLDAWSPSRFVLAAATTRVAQTRALSVVADDTQDYATVSRAAGAARGPLRIVAPTQHGWFRRRTSAVYDADGCDLGSLDLSEVGERDGGVVLQGSLGKLTLGVTGLVGYDDQRMQRLISRARRRYGALAHAWAQRWEVRAPFTDVDWVVASLRADVAYVIDGKLRRHLANTAYAAHFAHVGARDLAPLVSPTSPAKRKASGPVVSDLDLTLREDDQLESEIWALLSDTASIGPRYVDQRDAHGAFWDYFRRNDAAARQPLLRYASLELWLRQLLGGARHDAPRAETRVDVSERPIEVSVIVPAYNVEAYVAECLNSLTNQHVEAAEFLVINDGSTDDTAAVVERCAQRDPRIKLVNTTNGGVYAARNRGLALAQGRFVSFVDADDYVHPAMLQSLIATAEEHASEVAFCDAFQFGEDGEATVRGSTLRFPAYLPLSLATHPEMISVGFTMLWNRVYRRDFLVSEGLQFEAQHRISADMLFLQQVVSRAHTVVRVPRPLYYYRIGAVNSLTSYEVRNAQYRTHLTITRELIDFWVREGVFERYAPYVLERAVRNFLWNTHIDMAKLREVFDELHAYVRTLPIAPTDLARLSPLERQTVRALRSGNFQALLRDIGGYRTQMVLSKGGVLSTGERVSSRLRSLTSAISTQLLPSAEHDRAKKRLRIQWPGLGIRVAVEYAPETTAKSLAPADPALEAQASSTVALRTRFRNRMLLQGDLERALRRRKAGASVRVLHLSNAFSVPSETFTYDVLTGLERMPELDNYVIFFKRELERERPFPKSIQLHGSSRADLERGEPRLLENLERVLEALRPDVIHCHFGWVGIPLVRWMETRARPIPIVVTMHGTDVNMWPGRHPWYIDALKGLGSQPWVAVTTHTETYRNKLERLGVPPLVVEVIPNSFDPMFLAELDVRESEPRSHFRIISVARMDVWKGQSYLIDAFAEFVSKVDRNAALTLVGYGQEERALRAQIQQRGLRENVRFYGRASHHEIPVLLRHHDVYVQPSIRHPETLQEEGQPIAVLEAIASGLPVVVTDTGAMAETVRVGAHDGVAYVVPDKDPHALFQALTQLRASPPKPARVRRYVDGIVAKHAQGSQLSATARVYGRLIGRELGRAEAEPEAVRASEPSDPLGLPESV